MQFDRLKRREFITLLSGAAAAWPLTARAQQARLPVIGYLNSAREQQYTHLTAVFRQGLAEGGYTEGRNVAVEYRWAEGDYERLPALAADLVRRKVAVIVTHGPPAAKAAKAATDTIPIVFTTGDDPIRTELVASINRPGGNVTGVTLVVSQVLTKRVEILHELLPKASVMAVLVNPNSTLHDVDRQEAAVAARTIGVAMHVLEAATDSRPRPGVCGHSRTAGRCARGRRRSVFQHAREARSSASPRSTGSRLCFRSASFPWPAV